jgi:MFS transporter, DHA3 family, macrolide efflux protein
MSIQAIDHQLNEVTPNWKPRFFTIWSGQAFAMLGASLVQFALVWWMTKSTGSATVLATGTLFALLPQIFISPFAGALVDRWNRRMVMQVAASTVALSSLLLVYLFAVGAVQVWQIYAIMLVRSAAGAFQFPAMQASTSLMVPKAQLARVAGLNQMLQGAMSIAAPSLGALLLSLFPLQVALLFNVAAEVTAVLPLLFISIPQPLRTSGSATTGRISVLHDMRDGLRYILSWPALMIVCLMATLINFLVTPAFSLMPILVTKHFGGQAMQLGMINSAFGLGMLAGGLLLSVWGGFKRRIYTSMIGLIGMGLGIFVIGLTPGSLFIVAVAAMLLAGIMNPIANGPLFATLQSRVAPDMQGRVMSMFAAAATAVTPLSLIIAGPLADAVGVQLWYVVGGLMCASMGVLGFFIPALRYMEDGKPARATDERQPPALSTRIESSATEIA